MAFLADIQASIPASKLWTILAFSFTATLLPLLVDYFRVLRARQKLPPGPFPLPVFGNFFAIPKSKPWITFEYWATYYDSPLITIWQGHRPTILCNDAWSISELLDKRANIYSSRPQMICMGDVIEATENNQVCQVYGDKWRLHRRIMCDELKVLTRDLLEKPDDFVMSIERYSCSVVSIIGWGRRISQINDQVAQIALTIMEGVDLIIPGLFIMEAIPLLSKFPSWLYPLPSRLNRGARQLQKFFYNLSKEGSQAEKDNFSKLMIKQQLSNGMNDQEVAALTANLIGGGVDTTSSSMISFILAMCVFQDKQKLAQEEIDRVVGTERSPDWSHEDSLPYVKAIVTEVLRWRTVTILGGIPHAPTQDDVYGSYLIPKGTPIMGNVWAIHRHPREFPEPDNFRPERFLNGLERPYPNKQGHNAFGWGRRQCSGQPLAEQGLFMSFARLLWAFEMKPGLDKDGKAIKLDIFAYSRSENMRPEPFQARFVPRTGRIAEVLRHEAEQAQQDLLPYGGETKVSLSSTA
ncbi:hypothetical protein LTS17_009187 [Exophiala oligosperma]